MANRIKDLLAAVRNRGPLRRRHHVVPRFYLERFADDGALGVLDTEEGKIWTTGTKDTAVIKNFYMVYDQDGEPYDIFEVEFLDKQVEGPAAPVLAKAAVGEDLTDKEREKLAVFIGIQSVRGKAFPKPVEDAMVRMAKLQLQLAAELIEDGYEVAGVREAVEEVLGREATDQEVQEFAESARNTQDYKYEVHRPAMLGHYMDIGLRTADLLLGYEWQVIRFDDPVLITADEPVWLEASGSVGPYGVGFGTADAIWMPLGPAAALRMVRPGLEEVDVATVDLERLNQGVAGQAHRFLYGDPELLDKANLEG